MPRRRWESLVPVYGFSLYNPALYRPQKGEAARATARTAASVIRTMPCSALQEGLLDDDLAH